MDITHVGDAIRVGENVWIERGPVFVADESNPGQTKVSGSQVYLYELDADGVWQERRTFASEEAALVFAETIAR